MAKIRDITPEEIKVFELEALQKAIDCFEGNAAKFARAMGTTPQNIQQWKRKGTVPPGKALKCQLVTKGKVQALDILIENEKLAMLEID